MVRFLIAALSLVITPTMAFAHAGERMVILTLPSGYYITGAALVVGLTALIVALGPRLPYPPSAHLSYAVGLIEFGGEVCAAPLGHACPDGQTVVIKRQS